MITDDLKTIRFMAEVIIRKVAGHHRRNQRLQVLRLEIGRIQDAYQDPRGDTNAALREQIADGLRALQTLAHGGVIHDGDPETNRDVESRLWLLIDMATFLIEKAHESQVENVWMGAVDELPF